MEHAHFSLIFYINTIKKKNACTVGGISPFFQVTIKSVTGSVEPFYNVFLFVPALTNHKSKWLH